MLNLHTLNITNLITCSPTQKIEQGEPYNLCLPGSLSCTVLWSGLQLWFNTTAWLWWLHPAKSAAPTISTNTPPWRPWRLYNHCSMLPSNVLPTTVTWSCCESRLWLWQLGPTDGCPELGGSWVWRRALRSYWGIQTKLWALDGASLTRSRWGWIILRIDELTSRERRRWLTVKTVCFLCSCPADMAEDPGCWLGSSDLPGAGGPSLHPDPVGSWTTGRITAQVQRLSPDPGSLTFDLKLCS